MFDKCPICESEPTVRDDIEFENHLCVICETCGFISEPVMKGKGQEKMLADKWMAAVDEYNSILLGLNIEL